VPKLGKEKLATLVLKAVREELGDSFTKPSKSAPAKLVSRPNGHGAAYAVLAGRPSKDAVVTCFGKSGYALSWVARAERLGMSAQELCERFRNDAPAVKKMWAALEAKTARTHQSGLVVTKLPPMHGQDRQPPTNKSNSATDAVVPRSLHTEDADGEQVVQ